MKVAFLKFVTVMWLLKPEQYFVNFVSWCSFEVVLLIIRTGGGDAGRAILSQLFSLLAKII